MFISPENDKENDHENDHENDQENDHENDHENDFCLNVLSSFKSFFKCALFISPDHVQ